MFSQAIVSLCVAMLTYAAATSGALGPYNITSVTVGGLSAGAYFSATIHVALSSIISGAAIYAGGPWYCAEGDINTALGPCMSGSKGGPDTKQLISLTSQQAALNNIDDPSNMKNNHKVYIFSGMRDTVVDQSVILATQEYYENFLVDKTYVTSDYDLNANHCVPTLNYGMQCEVFGEPYLGKCDYDGAGAGLKAIYPEGTFANPRVEMVDRNLYAFDQFPYIPEMNLKYGDPYWSLGQMGFIYVPTSCQEGAACGLHISFHGCEMTVEDMDDTYARHAGFNEWAESNNLVVLYPYAKRGMNTANAYNPNGCFDWWGYTNQDYSFKSGIQIQFVKNLIDAVSGGTI